MTLDWNIILNFSFNTVASLVLFWTLVWIFNKCRGHDVTVNLYLFIFPWVLSGIAVTAITCGYFVSQNNIIFGG